MKSIYTYYKERLIEISGKNRSLYSKKISKKYAYDIGKIFDGDYDTINDFVDFLWKEKRYSFPIIKPDDKTRLFKTLGVEHRLAKSYADLEKLEGKEKSSAAFKLERQRRDETKRAINTQITALKNLKREIEEIERETGRSELYLCYPFVYGNVKNYTFRAPLLMFPVEIEIENDSSASISLKSGEPVQLNKALMYAFADAKRLNLEELETEFDCMKARFANLQKLLDYLASFGIRIAPAPRKNIFS